MTYLTTLSICPTTAAPQTTRIAPFHGCPVRCAHSQTAVKIGHNRVTDSGEKTVDLAGLQRQGVCCARQHRSAIPEQEEQSEECNRCCGEERDDVADGLCSPGDQELADLFQPLK